ncbi:cytochrome c biogenesis protein ResB [Planctomycetota bacterium]
MGKLRNLIMLITLALIILLIFLSVYGAFLGPVRAKEMFNSMPASIYWLVLTLVLIAGLTVFRRLIRVPALLLIHLGCVLVILGSMLGSVAGHKMTNQLFGTEKIPAGKMIIYEGQTENHIFTEPEEQLKKLPFSIKLNDFRMEYYHGGFLQIQSRDGRRWNLPAEIGSGFFLAEDLGSVRIIKAFENFRINISDSEKTAVDDPGPGSNPALEVQFTDPNGAEAIRYVFERFPNHTHTQDKFLLSYRRVVSDYISELEVVDNNQVITAKSIEVNRPLHFGGYHFYQHSYDEQAGRYTVLSVTSDSGLYIVYAGYVFLCVGIFWQCWITQISAKLKLRANRYGN